MERPRVGTAPRIAGIEAATVVFFVIQGSCQFGFEERVDCRLEVLTENFGDVFF